MTNLYDLYVAMETYNNRVAYGSECHAWQDFVNDAYQIIGMAPWDDRNADPETSVPDNFLRFWGDVADGRDCSTYDCDTGMRV